MSGAVIVTGGASGIGRAVVEAALAEGWRAAILDLPGERLEEARGAFEPAGVHVSVADVSDEAGLTRAVRDAAEAIGPLSGLVNSAGIASDVPMLATGADLFRRTLEINVIGSFLAAREAARLMRRRGGAIVNLASVSGLRGNEGRVAYGASKGAVVNMTKVMAVELAPFGIRVNAVAPGPVETPMVRELHGEAVRRTWTDAVPMGRYGTPEEIAAAVLFLLDGRRSSYVTGHTLCADGGFASAGIMSGTSRQANAEG